MPTDSSESSGSKEQRRILMRRVLRRSLITLGFVLIVIGLVQGDVLRVLYKATLICLECIGIG